MKYDRFEDLPVWKTAIELAARICVLTRHRFYSQPGDLRDQIRRSSLSISNNIAEGFECGSTAELLAFLYIARGSAGETRSMLRFSLCLLQNPEMIVGIPESEISNLRSAISDLIPIAESCSRQIRAWADSLQNTEIKGQRHLNEQSRNAYAAEGRSLDFQRRMREQFRDNHPELFREMEDGP
ncbi:MAG: four helix bundle protein [Thermoguttaceae bacterium]